MRKAKVKRGTAAGNLHFGPSVHSFGNNWQDVKRVQDLAGRKQ